jgi:hypothetical protein
LCFSITTLSLRTPKVILIFSLSLFSICIRNVQRSRSQPSLDAAAAALVGLFSNLPLLVKSFMRHLCHRLEVRPTQMSTWVEGDETAGGYGGTRQAIFMQVNYRPIT